MSSNKNTVAKNVNSKEPNKENTKDNAKDKFLLVLSMIIFGTIGIFRRYIELPSGFLAMSRGFIGTAYLVIFVLATKKGISRESIKKNALPLILSGAFIGFNWILLFEAYNYTSVAVATLCYYMAPMIVIAVSPVILKEKLSGKKIVCVLVALVGMVLVSGVTGMESFKLSEMKGVLLGLGAAQLYATVVLMNKKIKDIGPYDKTIVQLASAGAVMLVYTLLVENVSKSDFSLVAVIMLVIVGVVHTGVAYAWYFGSMKSISAQTVALFSYLDPIIAIVLSAVILREDVGAMEAVGAVMVLGAAVMAERE